MLSPAPFMTVIAPPIVLLYPSDASKPASKKVVCAWAVPAATIRPMIVAITPAVPEVLRCRIVILEFTFYARGVSAACVVVAFPKDGIALEMIL